MWYSKSLFFAMAALMFKNIFFRIFVGFHGTFLLHPVCLMQEYRASPVLPNTDYLWGSNAPIEFCDELHGVSIDMSLFALSGSPRKQITEQGIAIFYIHKLGYYPFVELETGENVNGGIPQLGCLRKHLDKATNDIRYYIASNTPGLAVIDWPEWRPIWGRNKGLKEVYMERSIDLALKQNPSFAYWEALRAAENEFEHAGRGFMAETLKLGRSLRPKSLWGFYFYPECYNKDYEKPEFSGTCADIEKQRNDDLHWLWKESTALYPSVYLNTRITAQNQAIFVRNRVLEAFRISQKQSPKNPLPVIAYFRPVFTDMPEIFLSKNDLVDTIGESMALGVSGMVMWGGYEIIQSLEDCRNIDNFITETLNPYIINVTLAAKMCNQVLCQNKGVCIRKHWNSSDYLHLNPETFVIQALKGGDYAMHGNPTIKDLRQFTQNFHCSCYAGVNCRTTVDVKTTDNIHVCVRHDICINTLISPKLSDTSRWNKRASIAYSNVSFSTPLDRVAPCVPGKDLNENLKTKCLVEILSNNLREDNQSHIYIQDNKNEVISSSTSSLLIKFPFYILHVLIAFALLYLVI